MHASAPLDSSTRVTVRSGLSWRWQSVSFFAAFFITVLRRPDAVLHAQFFAEDGSRWFAEAYNNGWLKVLFWTDSGYIQVLPRLAASLALLVHTVHAPLVENVIAICFEVLPVNLLLSPRCEALGSVRFRSALAALYLALPNTVEMIATITASQWFLALSILLIVSMGAPRSRVSRIFEGVLLILCSLTGPFCFFLLPVSAFELWRGRGKRWHLWRFGALLAGTFIQSVALFTHTNSRPHANLGANLECFFRIVGGQIYSGAILGVNGLSLSLSPAVLAVIAVTCTVLSLSAALRSPRVMKSLLLFAACILAASLANPTGYPHVGMTRWQMVASVPGIRYWFLPSLAFIWILAHCVRYSKGMLRVGASVLLFLLPVGVIRDFRYRPLPNLNFAEYAKELDNSPRGAWKVIPENPTGWKIMVKKY